MTSTDIKTMWKEYCSKSTIVGLRYIVEPKKRLYERIGWTLLVVFAAAFVLFMYVATWYEFVKGPTRLVVDNPRYPLERIDFPAITICPINKAMYNKSVAYTVETLGENSTKDERDRFLNSIFAMSLMRYPYYDQPITYLENANMSMTLLNKSDITNMMLKLLPTVKEMFDTCWWRGTIFNCEDILRLQKTEEGFCYSFNSKTAERNSVSSINPPFESTNGTYKAMRSTSAGKLTGFEFRLKNLEDEYFPVDTRFKGYNIVIHSPENFPDVASNFVMYHYRGKVIRIPLKVSTVIGHESLLKLSDEQRDGITPKKPISCWCHNRSDTGCFFVDEFTYSQSYSSEVPAYFANDAENCYQRCRLGSIETYCNCTPYFFQSSNIQLYSTCGIADLECLRRVNVLQRNTPPSPNLPGFPKWSLPEYMNCSCPLPCTFVSYSTEIEQTFADLLDEPEYYIYGEVFYRELFAISYSRFVKFSFKELLVSLGTLASLFLGCSLISIAELIYFSLRSVTFFIHSKVTEENETNETAEADAPLAKEKESKLFGLIKVKGDVEKVDVQSSYPYRMYYRMNYPMLKRHQLIQKQNVNKNT